MFYDRYLTITQFFSSKTSVANGGWTPGCGRPVLEKEQAVCSSGYEQSAGVHGN